jgi:hypothetical protein
MVTGNGTGRYVIEKGALLAILAISLLTAWLAVEMRSVTRLSAPIELSHSGLSISMPSGNGWRCEGKWIYDDDGFTISSIFAIGAGPGRSFVRCRYLLARQRLTPLERFSEEAAAINGELVETGQITAGQLVVDWARIKGDTKRVVSGPFEMVLGVCELPAGRQLEIEVLQTTDERDMVQSIFERIAKGVRFSDNGLLQAGEQIVSQARISSPNEVANDSRLTFFILADSRGRTIGFTMEATAVQTGEQSAIKAAGYYYIRGPVPSEEVSVFRGDIAFEKFTWRVETSSPAGRKGIEIESDSGVLTVRNLRAGGKESEYTLGGAAVPDIVLEPVLRKMLDSEPQEIVIDVIRSEGTVVPMYVEKMNQADGNSIRIELLDGRGFWQRTYYDNTRQPVKILLEQENTYTLQRADANEIAEAFPERSDFVRDKGQLLDREEL